jgi:hypothetical protein
MNDARWKSAAGQRTVGWPGLEAQAEAPVEHRPVRRGGFGPVPATQTMGLASR